MDYIPTSFDSPITVDKEDVYSWLLAFVIICVVISSTLVFSRVAAFFVSRWLNGSAKKLKIDQTRFKFVINSISTLVITLGFALAVYVVPSLRTLSLSLFTGIGLFTLIIGFASQHSLSNIITGVFIAIYKPFRIDDEIKIPSNNIWGYVEDINLRHTVVRSFNRTRIIIPNSVISSEVVENFNIVDEKMVKWFEVGISYDSDFELAQEVLASCVRTHKDYLDHRTQAEINDGLPSVRTAVVRMEDSSVVIRAWVWVKNSAASYAMMHDLNLAVLKAFKEHSIEIPYPMRNVWFRNKLKVNKKVKNIPNSSKT